MSLAIGTCTRFPNKLCGRRARVLPFPDVPHAGEIGTIIAINGVFAPAHDGLDPCDCVHIDVHSSVTLRFAHDLEVSGYRIFVLELLPARYKVWTIDPDGEPSTRLPLDTEIDFGDDVGKLAEFAWELSDRVPDQTPLLIKNFDNEKWWRASVVDGALKIESVIR